jgi:hypothetical protein
MTNFSVIFIKHSEKDTYARSGYVVVKNLMPVIVSLSENGHGLAARSVCAVSHINEKIEKLIDAGKLAVIAQPSDKKETRPKKHKSEEQEGSQIVETFAENYQSSEIIEPFEEKTVTDSLETEQL